jgi:hypothetical protein
MADKLTIGQWLKQNKMSVVSLAKLLHCTPQSIHNWKAGKSYPHHLFIKKLMNITRNEVEL